MKTLCLFLLFFPITLFAQTSQVPIQDESNSDNLVSEAVAFGMGALVGAGITSIGRCKRYSNLHYEEIFKSNVDINQDVMDAIVQIAGSSNKDYGKKLNEIQRKMIESVSEKDIEKVSKLTRKFIKKSHNSHVPIDLNNSVYFTLKKGFLDEYPELSFAALKAFHTRKQLEQNQAQINELLELQGRPNIGLDLLRDLSDEISKLKERARELAQSSEMAMVSLQEASQKRSQNVQIATSIIKAINNSVTDIIKNAN